MSSSHRSFLVPRDRNIQKLLWSDSRKCQCWSTPLFFKDVYLCISTDETLRNDINVYKSSFLFLVQYGCCTVRSAKALLIGLNKYFCVWNKCQGFEKKEVFNKKLCFCPFLLTDFLENNDGVEFVQQLRRYYQIHS